MNDKEIRRILASARFKFRSDTLNNWQTNNPVLLEGEAGVVTGLNVVGDGLENKSEKIKFGDGMHDWNSLDWWYGPEGQGGGSITVDQTFKSNSENAQSGIAISTEIDERLRLYYTKDEVEEKIENKVGNIEAVLENIIEIQENLIGGGRL